jgi:hypothetical protein
MDLRTNHDRSATKKVGGLSKTLAQAMTRNSALARGRLLRQNELQTMYMDIVAQIRCASDKRQNEITVEAQPGYITKRLTCINGFKITENGDGRITISWPR